MTERPRVVLINNLIKKYNFKNYLEIGIDKGITFRSIKCKSKESVDPCFPPYSYAKPTHKMTSDDFFMSISPDKKWDIIFIDGLHHSDQVDKDIINSINHLSENGFIILHDCNPLTYEAQVIPRQTTLWNGDVWKSIVKFRQTNTEYGCIVLNCDQGLGIISKTIPVENIKTEDVDYKKLSSDRKYYLGLVDSKTIL